MWDQFRILFIAWGSWTTWGLYIWTITQREGKHVATNTQTILFQLLCPFPSRGVRSQASWCVPVLVALKGVQPVSRDAAIPWPWLHVGVSDPTSRFSQTPGLLSSHCLVTKKRPTGLLRPASTPGLLSIGSLVLLWSLGSLCCLAPGGLFPCQLKCASKQMFILFIELEGF